MMDSKNFVTSTLFEICNRVPQRGSRVSGISPLPQSNFLGTKDLLFFKQWVYYSQTAINSPHKYLQGTLISYEKSTGGS